MAKDKRPIKEFEATPNPWKADQKPVTVQFDPKTGPKGKATIQKEGEAHNEDVEKLDKTVAPVPIEEVEVKPEKPKRKAKPKTETPTEVFPADARINDYGFLGFKTGWLADLGWTKGMALRIDKNPDGSITLRKA
jgi:hypothetical protein